jgi:glycosyltransferase involved in cell wall biosynthesis
MDTHFSVVIPLFNKEKSIASTVMSVLNQSHDKFELIVVNDGSTDQSLLQVRQIKDGRIQLHTIANRGVAAARNYGVTKATNDFIAFLDADDLWKPNHLITINKLISDFPKAQLFATGYLRSLRGHNIKNKYYIPMFNQNYRGLVDNFFEANLGSSIVMIPCIAIRKSVFQALNGFNPKYNAAEDIDFWIRFGNTYQMAFDSKVTVEVNLSSENKLTQLPLSKKTLPSFTDYREWEKTNTHLNKYVDMNRFVWAMEYKLNGKHQKFKTLMGHINKANLSTLQRFSTKVPGVILRPFIHFRNWLLQKGIYLRLLRP